jgi:hypothetical protein
MLNGFSSGLEVAQFFLRWHRPEPEDS